MSLNWLALPLPLVTCAALAAASVEIVFDVFIIMLLSYMLFCIRVEPDKRIGVCATTDSIYIIDHKLLKLTTRNVIESGPGLINLFFSAYTSRCLA